MIVLSFQFLEGNLRIQKKNRLQKMDAAGRRCCCVLICSAYPGVVVVLLLTELLSQLLCLFDACLCGLAN